MAEGVAIAEAAVKIGEKIVKYVRSSDAFKIHIIDSYRDNDRHVVIVNVGNFHDDGMYIEEVALIRPAAKAGDLVVFIGKDRFTSSHNRPILTSPYYLGPQGAVGLTLTFRHDYQELETEPYGIVEFTLSKLNESELSKYKIPFRARWKHKGNDYQPSTATL